MMCQQQQTHHPLKRFADEDLFFTEYMHIFVSSGNSKPMNLPEAGYTIARAGQRLDKVLMC